MRLLLNKLERLVDYCEPTYHSLLNLLSAKIIALGLTGNYSPRMISIFTSMCIFVSMNIIPVALLAPLFVLHTLNLGFSCVKNANFRNMLINEAQRLKRIDRISITLALYSFTLLCDLVMSGALNTNSSASDFIRPFVTDLNYAAYLTVRLIICLDIATKMYTVIGAHIENLADEKDTRLYIYIRNIEFENHALFHEQFSLDLSNCSLEDPHMVRLMQALQAHPDIARKFGLLLVRENNITALPLASTLTNTHTIDANKCALREVTFPDTLLSLNTVNMNDNKLSTVNIPEAILPTLRSIMLQDNPLTDVTKFILVNLRTRFPQLNVTPALQHNVDLTTEQLKNHFNGALIPKALSLHKIIPESFRRATVLISKWRLLKPEGQMALPFELVDKIMSYVARPPVTIQDAFRKVTDSKDMLERCLQAPPEDLVDQIDAHVQSRQTAQRYFNSTGYNPEQAITLTYTKSLRDAVAKDFYMVQEEQLPTHEINKLKI